MTTGPDLIREFNDAVERQDLAAFSKRLHRDVVWRHNIGLGTLEEGGYKGRETVMALFERILEPWNTCVRRRTKCAMSAAACS